MKKKLLVSFSGGRTSAFMVWWLLNEWPERHNWEIIIVFANTGKEVEGTLFFIDECAQEWNINIIWIEAKCKDENGVPFSKKGWRVKHKVVSYETASRKGEPFEEMISMLGIPNQAAPFCSPQLKREAIKSYARSIGWDDYYTAIGIRYEEASERMNANWIAKKLYYPLIFDNPTTKRDILIWWSKQSFDLDIHPDDGNCDDCWKKSDIRLARNMNRKPESFNWWQSMTDKYGSLVPKEDGSIQTFFRGNKSVADIRELATLPQAQIKQNTLFDQDNPCNESCEAF